ncbi:MAG: DEAD/DEAH box helicase [Propionibacteriales bacterium]|nr:DEAD/DEAH box helicase [Propionibacteriales bacterium]
MRDVLREWIADAETRGNVAAFGIAELLPDLAYQEGRNSDLRSSLVGELFDLLRNGTSEPRDWATVGSGLARAARPLTEAARSETLFYAAAAYYLGGYSASAYVTMRPVRAEHLGDEVYGTCYDLLARSRSNNSEQVRELMNGLREGEGLTATRLRDQAREAVDDALSSGPDEWVGATLLAALLERFAATNVRAVLPNGADPRWSPLVGSFLDRRPPVWDFFPSQREAIDAGLLTSNETYSLQMPTGAGKTALTETLIYNHLVGNDTDLAVLLVPFRSLGSELRASLGQNLTDLGYPTKTVYGGIVPSSEETSDIESARVIIATPESLTGLLDSVPELLDRLTLLVCDEGHLVESEGRGVGLELLLARFLARDTPPRVVFISAIVPNIEDLNSWLGGTDETVVRSDFRPADIEYSVLRPSEKAGRKLRVALEMKPPADTTLPIRILPGFLTADDFDFTNSDTGKQKIWANGSVKAQAVAAARKALPLGVAAVFSTAKSGNQGVLALAEELSKQRTVGLPLPDPAQFVPQESLQRVAHVLDYLTTEYGAEWAGTTALSDGAIVHHGDVPQETREVLEDLLRGGHIKLVFCTGTLAEGVNLPIKTLVLYSTSRMKDGTRVQLLIREIKNLVGRAGRAGSETKGLVICANPASWARVSQVADGATGENVRGALLTLLQQANLRTSGPLTNDLLEGDSDWLALADGIDATLLELLHDDLGAEEFEAFALRLADSTYAFRQANDDAKRDLERVFSLRARRLLSLRANGRLGLSTGTGARVRLVDSVLDGLLPSFGRWTADDTTLDDELLASFVGWAWTRPEMRSALMWNYYRKAYEHEAELPPADDLLRHLRLWLSGRTFHSISEQHPRDIDDVLRIHAGVVAFTFATLVEQAVAVLGKYFEGRGEELSLGLSVVPAYLRHGTRDPDALELLTNGVRHRRAAILLAGNFDDLNPDTFFLDAREKAALILETDPGRWVNELGRFVFDRTVRDVGADIPLS